MKDLLTQLAEASRACSKPEYAKLLNATCLSIGNAIDYLAVRRDDEALRFLNSEWAYGARLLKELPTEADPTASPSGDAEPAALAA